jgi:ABC-type branched-subunit amino acid transport system substrate-binding protein
MLTKLKSNNVKAVFNISFQPDSLASLKNMKALGMDATFVSVSEIVTPEIIGEYSKMLENSILFGLSSPEENFVKKLSVEYPNKTVSSYQAAATGYLHVKQIANAFNKCSGEIVCARGEMDKSAADSIIGFSGFKNHIAGYKPLIQEWQNGKFVDIEK